MYKFFSHRNSRVGFARPPTRTRARKAERSPPGLPFLPALRSPKARSFRKPAQAMNAASTAAAAPAPAATVQVPRGQVDLIDFIDWTGVECLNQDSSHSIVNALKQSLRDDEGLYLASDSDEQLLIYIPFMQVVKLHSALFKGPEEEGPKTVKLFSNKEHMGFSNVNDYPPSDTLELSSDHLIEMGLGLSFLQNKLLPLKYVKFQNVRSLTIFIEDNQSGSDVSKIHKIALYGTTVDTTNMKDLKKIEEH
ncbi:thioredoxin-like protein 1 isoform X1 [Zea mays]|uniref:thioredoxin-like protein 1 isoform X1 n=1 Tax=Zea mays TaxID=4577 RepID=UPI0016521604|nr:thioredoxin-like protein 1 isoform X1 [Zea mays]